MSQNQLKTSHSDSESFKFDTEEEIKIDGEFSNDHEVDGDESPAEVFELLEKKKNEASLAAIAYLLGPITALYSSIMKRQKGYSNFIVGFHCMQSLLLFVAFWTIALIIYIGLSFLSLGTLGVFSLVYFVCLGVIYLLIGVFMFNVTHKAAMKEVRNKVFVIGDIAEKFSK
eukprot:GAHX01001063.1.p1 GENE.GAHX01001063.1~~GAHX01001063.1.p1  ORF type:complete len:185 (-),score=37.43 GAHX01001063.1:127-639(-)